MQIALDQKNRGMIKGPKRRLCSNCKFLFSHEHAAWQRAEMQSADGDEDRSSIRLKNEFHVFKTGLNLWLG